MTSHSTISALDVALEYIKRGWNPLPLPFRTKKPVDKGWQRRVIREQDAPKYFNSHAQNIGVVLGPSSGGLTDVDLDCPEAIAIAPYILPQTAIFGRSSARDAHWLYKTDLAEADFEGDDEKQTEDDKATIKITDKFRFHNEKDKKSTIVELRIGGSKGAQTVFPGSTHESGEAITWEEAGEPIEIDGAELIKHVRVIAVGALLIRYWPGLGAKHDAALAVGGFLARVGFTPEWIKYFVERIAREAGCGDVADKAKAAFDLATNTLAGKKTWGLKTISEFFGKEQATQIAELLNYQGSRDEGRSYSDRAGDQPAIQIEDGELSSLATQGEELLIAAGVQIYQRGGKLVRPIIEVVDATRGRQTRVVQLKILDDVYLRDLLCRYARWEKYNVRSKKPVPVNPPSEIAQTILARTGDWRFPAIAGVISAPTMRPDGSLLIEPGYDETTRLLLVEPPAMPEIPNNPTRDDALQALKLLEALLTGFPFSDETAKSCALSAMITPVVRGAFPVTPMHASRAPAAASGKSFLWDVCAAIAIGQPMPVISTGGSPEETEKRLGSAFLAGQPLISIDNINGELGGDALCQLIERPTVDVRVLGRSESVRIEARGTSLFATGNNFVIVGDVCRRTVTTNLDPGVERPELRQFDFDPVDRVLADRGKYIVAALTICRAYCVAGRPNRAPKLASFEGWSDTVRSALMWLGKKDPVDFDGSRKGGRP